MSQLYRICGKIIGQVLSKKAGVKNLVYNSSSSKKKNIYALVCETLRYKCVIDKLIQAVATDGFDELKQIREKYVLYAMIYDSLFGKKKIQGGGKIKRLLQEIGPRLTAALETLTFSQGGILLEKTLQRPNQEAAKYARVNILKIDAETAFSRLVEQGFQCQWDTLVSSLLVISPTMKGLEAEGKQPEKCMALYNSPMVLNGELILQDKASCFPVQALSLVGWQDGDALDACAAPGNKTTQLAALIRLQQNSNDRLQTDRRVYAFDKSPDRLKVLQRRVQEAGADSIVVPMLQDFLDASPSDERFAKVQAILLDPSCSGSGINCPGRLNEKQDERTKKDKARIEKLAAFQLAALLKAFSFPQVQFVVYSTCSVHQAENEEVVSRALRKETAVSHSPPFHLVHCLPGWPRRGQQVDGLSKQEAEKMARALPDDGTNGFFVAVLQRDQLVHKTCYEQLPGPVSKSLMYRAKKENIGCARKIGNHKFSAQCPYQKLQTKYKKKNNIFRSCLYHTALARIQTRQYQWVSTKT